LASSKELRRAGSTRARGSRGWGSRARSCEGLLPGADVSARDRAVDALETQDVELCDEVIAFDDEVDERYLALERQIEMVLARQTPVASDLHLVLAILHSGLHIERIGDQCVTIAKLTKLSSHLHTKRAVMDGLVAMGER